LGLAVNSSSQERPSLLGVQKNGEVQPPKVWRICKRRKGAEGRLRAEKLKIPGNAVLAVLKPEAGKKRSEKSPLCGPETGKKP